MSSDSTQACAVLSPAVTAAAPERRAVQPDGEAQAVRVPQDDARAGSALAVAGVLGQRPVARRACRAARRAAPPRRRQLAGDVLGDAAAVRAPGRLELGQPASVRTASVPRASLGQASRVSSPSRSSRSARRVRPGPAEQHAVGQLGHPQPRAGRLRQLHEHVVGRQRQLVLGDRARPRATGDGGVRTQEVRQVACSAAVSPSWTVTPSS
jgi:hypothetical protein